MLAAAWARISAVQAHFVVAACCDGTWFAGLVAAGVPRVVAVGVNCCAPSEVPQAITAAREVTGKPVIVYPNSGEQ